MRSLTALCAVGLAACSPIWPAPPEYEHASEGFARLHYTKPNGVDILIVLDNSSSMAEEQAALANSLEPFIEVLESEGVAIDYRIAITTTDAGHPACPSSTPERGAFMLSPCTSRLDEFVTDGEGGPSDVRALSCTDICNLSATDLAISPTTTDEDPTPAPRPWLEWHGDGHTNLPAGVDMRDALRCFAPQGVAGCDFETPLESMYQALLRAKDANDPAYGFLRKDAKLFVLFITDEDDCSVAPGSEQLFSGSPTSATCWNAGVACIGDPTEYDTCEAIDDGGLRPPSRYVELFDTIMADKWALNPTQRPLIAVVGGVDSQGDLHFGDVQDTDPEFQQTFGIGPGCQATSPDPDRPIRATPPVRLHAVQDAMGLDSIYSVCEDEWTIALELLAGWGGPQIHPACFPQCVHDTDFTTPTAEPDCIVEEEIPDGGTQHIEECMRGELGYLVDPETEDYQLPPDADVCYAALTDDSGSTPTTTDDMSETCSEQSMNLEFEIARRPGHPAAGGTWVTATCLLAQFPELNCPGLDE